MPASARRRLPAPMLLVLPVLGLSMLVLAGCSPPPPAGPEADGGSPPNARARGVIDAQLAAHPDGTEPGLSGDEASVIYRNHLRAIGQKVSIAGPQAGGLAPATSNPSAGGGSAGGGYP